MELSNVCGRLACPDSDSSLGDTVGLNAMMRSLMVADKLWRLPLRLAI